MRRLAVLLAAAVAGGLVGSTAADAHPLGNFTVNRLTEVSVSSGRVDVRYTLDQAEIPTVRERDRAPAELLAAKQAEAVRGLTLVADGRRVRLTPRPGAQISFPPGQGGLRTTRVEVALAARVDRPRRVDLRDATFAGRPGWRAVVARPGEGTAVRSSVPSEDMTRGLRAYPRDLIGAPPDEGSARLRVEPGDGTLVAPRARGGGQVTTARGGEDGFAGLFGDAAAGRGVLVVLLLAAAGWGAVHALSPGHGKAMVAAYLVGTRGRPRHAVALGATVTVTHTAGVFALGLVTLAASQWILPEDLYPWLTLLSGLLVLAVGLGVLRSRARARAHVHDHDHHHHDHHHHPREVGWKGILGMGASAGLIPCPSALVVLLGAIAQHQVALGMALIVAFSAGLAATLTALGLLVVYAQRVGARVDRALPVVRVLPALSAAAIVIVGAVITAGAIPQVV
jgi:nickel/cobalt transporter (NicO) family protein